MITLDGVITEKELRKFRQSGTTASKLSRADDLLDLSIKERKAIYAPGNRALVEAGLCDGQNCIYHKFLPGRRGCYCKLTGRSHQDRQRFKEIHILNCSLNGKNDLPEFECPAYKKDPYKDLDMVRPAYMTKVIGRKVI